MQYTEDEFRNLASQLSHPKGEMGLEVGMAMNQSNATMINPTIQSLRLSGGEYILELGHGNGSHIADLMSQAKDLHYTGLEVSELMHEEAKKVAAKLISKSKADFHLYSDDQFPFDVGSFDKIITVNTVYFWKNPEAILSEMFRVLKSGGSAHIAFGQKSSMELLPFVKFGFELYDTLKMKSLLNTLPWKSIHVDEHADQIPFGPNETMSRSFGIATAIK